jgi:hypothetical protein
LNGLHHLYLHVTRYQLFHKSSFKDTIQREKQIA